MHVNEQVVRRFYEAFQKEDVSEIQAVCAPDLVWHEVGRNALSGELPYLSLVALGDERSYPQGANRSRSSTGPPGFADAVRPFVDRPGLGNSGGLDGEGVMKGGCP